MYVCGIIMESMKDKKSKFFYAVVSQIFFRLHCIFKLIFSFFIGLLKFFKRWASLENKFGYNTIIIYNGRSPLVVERGGKMVVVFIDSHVR